MRADSKFGFPSRLLHRKRGDVSCKLGQAVKPSVFVPWFSDGPVNRFQEGLLSFAIDSLHNN